MKKCTWKRQSCFPSPSAPPTPPVFHTRILWSWTLNVWGKVTSLTIDSCWKLMFVFSAASILLTAAIAKKVFGPLAGLISAGVIACYYLNVVTDVRIFPDGMGIAMLLCSMLLFLKYLESGTWWHLGVCGAITGLLFPIKEYYIIVAGAYLFSLCLRPRAGSSGITMQRRLSEVGVYLGLFALGASTSLILHYFNSGNPFGQFGVLDFGDKELQYIYFDKDLSPAGMFVDRLAYLRHLFTENGIIGGVLLFGGGLYLAANWKRREDCRVLLNAAAIFILFLSFMPAKFNPLVFIVAQSRYMLVFTPFLAVGVGGLVSAMFAKLENEKGLRSILWVTLGLCAALNLWLPNYRYGDKPSVLTAINACVDQQDRLGFTHLILPWQMWQWAFITEYDSRRHFILADRGESKTRAEYGDFKDALQRYPGAAVFVSPSMMQDKSIRSLLCGAEFRIEPIMLPNSSVNTWFTRLGHPRGLTIAGYVFVRNKP